MEAPSVRPIILVLDEERPLLQRIRAFLEFRDMDCRTSTDAAAIEGLARRPVDVVLADVHMSGMEGLELLERVARIDPDLPVIALNERPTVDSAVRYLKAGAYDYLAKPLDLEQLVEIVHRAFEKRRLAQENAALKDALFLHRITQAVAAAVDECEVLELVLQCATRELHADQVALFVKEEPGSPLARWRGGAESAAGLAGFEESAARLAGVEERAARLAVERDEGWIVSGKVIREALGAPVGGVIAAPLRTHEGVLGAITALRHEGRRPFTRGNQHMLSILAGNAAAAIGNARNARRIVETRAGLEEAHAATIGALVSALDAREHETQVHSIRVTEYALRLAAELELDLTPAEELDLKFGAMLHDIGKIGIPDHILLKPGPLTDAEWEQMRRHPTIGYQILRHIRFLEEAARIVLYHQERCDGTGYPFGLAGIDIPVGARLFAIVDVFDAMTTDRPYRAALGYQDAVAEMERQRGRQLDAPVVDAFLRIPLEEWVRIGEEAGESPVAWGSASLGGELALHGVA
jgi:putative nucleotidyltransferase with HDIG domain